MWFLYLPGFQQDQEWKLVSRVAVPTGMGRETWGGNSHLLSSRCIQRQALAALFHAPHQCGALPVDKLSLSALDKPGNRLRLSILLIVCHWCHLPFRSESTSPANAAERDTVGKPWLCASIPRGRAAPGCVLVSRSACPASFATVLQGGSTDPHQSCVQF